MSGFTPGPWVASDFGGQRTLVTSPDIHAGRFNRVAVIGRENLSWCPEHEANARLIVAAPDSHAANVRMVDALNVAFGITSRHDDDYIYDTLPTSAVATAYFAARAAIAKATTP